MRTLKLVLAYDGTDFVGWQRQASGTSVQGLLEDALRPIVGSSVTVIGAGRTDAGVHARAQVASVEVSAAIPPPLLKRALNAVLPEAVRILDVEEMAPGFHARYAVRAKTYHYRIFNGEAMNPFERKFAWHVSHPLDAEAMKRAADALTGRRDFAAFRAAGSSVASNVRTIHRSTLITEADPEGWRGRWIVYEICGDGFLRHMVRNIVGTLVEVGAGRRAAVSVLAIIESRDRAQAGPTAPSHGLFLTRIDYDAPPAPAA